MQAAQHRERHNPTHRRRLTGPGHRRVLAQRELGPGRVVAAEVLAKHESKVLLVDDDDVIQREGGIYIPAKVKQ